MVERNDRSATTIPAERFAKRYMEVKRQISFRAVVLQNALGQLGPFEAFGELSRRGIGGVARTGNIVFLDQIKVDFEHSHRQMGRQSFGLFTIGVGSVVPDR